MVSLWRQVCYDAYSAKTTEYKTLSLAHVLFFSSETNLTLTSISKWQFLKFNIQYIYPNFAYPVPVVAFRSNLQPIAKYYDKHVEIFYPFDNDQ